MLFRPLGFVFTGARAAFYRADEYVRVAAFQARLPFNCSDAGKVLGETQQQLSAQIDVSYFASAELHHSLHAVAFFEETDGVVFLEFVIVIVGIRPEFEFLDLNHVLLLFCVVLLLFLFVLPLPVIHGLCHGWFRGGSDQDQVEPHILRLAHGGGGGHDLNGAVREDSANFFDPNRFVYVFSNSRPTWRETSGWIHAGLANGAGPRLGIRKDEIQMIYLVLVYMERRPKALVL